MISVQQLGEVRGNNSLSRADLTAEKTGSRVVHYGDIHTKLPAHLETILELPTVNRGSLQALKPEHLVEKGDLLIADASEDYADIGKTIEVICTPEEPTYAGLHTILFRPKPGACAIGYLAYAFQGWPMRLEIMRRSQGSKVLGLNKSQFVDLEIALHDVTEQKKIADFLKTVDVKLRLLRACHDALTEYKKGVMQKIFTQTLRFKADDGSDFPDWEMGTLKEVANIVGGGTPETAKVDFWGGAVQWFTPSEIKMKYLGKSKRTITPKGLKASSAKLLPKGALLLSTRATIGDIGIASEECSTNQGFQSLVMIGDNINEFWYYWILQNQRDLLRRSQGSTFLEIGKSEVEKTKILKPHPDEQQKIAAFLSAIDDKITAVSSQITHMQDFKKGLLQQMFV